MTFGRWSGKRRLRVRFVTGQSGGLGVRPPGHYEPAARSSLTVRRHDSCEARPEPVVISGETAAPSRWSAGRRGARPRRAPRLMSAELVAPFGAPLPHPHVGLARYERRRACRLWGEAMSGLPICEETACRACPICAESSHVGLVRCEGNMPAAPPTGHRRRTRRLFNQYGRRSSPFPPTTCGAAHIASNLPRNFLIFRKARQASNAFA